LTQFLPGGLFTGTALPQQIHYYRRVYETNFGTV